MRGGSQRASETVSVSARQFEWDRSLLAVLRHSTLPLDGAAGPLRLRAAPLRDVAQCGRRDRLSLLAQFAAHQALLRFSGIGDADLDPGEWAVIQKRGADCRLIRVAARAADVSVAPPVLTLAQQFADAVGAPALDIFRQSWARAESVYIEAFARLREDAAVDLQWTRRSAAGVLLAPGADALRDLAAGEPTQHTYSDHAVIEALESLAALDGMLRVVVLRGRAIVRYGALDGLSALGLSGIEQMTEAAIVERVAAVLPDQRVIFAVAAPEAFDPASARVVQMLRTAGEATWIQPTPGGALPRTRWHVVAPRIAAARDLEVQLSAVEAPGDALEAFLASDALPAFLDHGVAVLGDSRIATIAEPARSYVAALALLGERFPCATAESFLREFLYERSLHELAIAGVTEIDGGEFRFVSAAARRSALEHIPRASRSSLCRIAASVRESQGDAIAAAMLLVEAGESRRAVEILDAVQWPDDAALIDTCAALPRTSLAAAPALASRYARALLHSARYRDARELAPVLAGDDREIVLAHAERRTGDYGPALMRLERIARCCEADLLRAEILSVQRRDAEALAILRSSSAADEDERVQLGYALALAGDDTFDWTSSPSPLRPYCQARLATYRALDRGDVDGALRFADEALRAATGAVQRIDALMDQVFALFSNGRWVEARSHALAALGHVEESQGDRGAGGLLFLLAYLAADDGQWVHAMQRITRLRHFYGGTKDARHLAELDLLAAHLEFSRGRFDDALRAASALLQPHVDEPIRIAAALIVDEIAWIKGDPPPRAVAEEPGNAEFAGRWRLNMSRNGIAAPPPERTFLRDLAEWNRSGGEPPVASTGSEKLALFRAAAGVLRRKNDPHARAVAAAIAREFGISFEAPGEPTSEAEGELRLLRAIATSPFPFSAHSFDRPWRYAVRNRLGQWNEGGSLPTLTREELDLVAEKLPPGWIACSDRELLYLAGTAGWPLEACEAVASAFRARAELYRLQRLSELEQAPSRIRPAAAGIIGESPVIREVIERATLIARRDVAVCVLGESGTGKELVARAIHSASLRRSKAFTAVNCGALPENLIESELFGHARGAFTGADRDRAGLIEATDGGTLFLDEIGELPLSAQAKLLRFLQEGEYRRVGDTAARTADVRIVTATNRKLDAAVEEGRFREDLYYRIAGVEIVLPPLRERGNDILALASHFLELEHTRHSTGPARFAPDVEAILMAYSWPGNVRELQNLVRGAHAMAGEAKEIGVEHLTERLRSMVVRRTVPGSYQDAVARFRRDLIERALAEAGGNQNRAATMLKISRQALGYQIRELGIMVGRRSGRTAM